MRLTETNQVEGGKYNTKQVCLHIHLADKILISPTAQVLKHFANNVLTIDQQYYS